MSVFSILQADSFSEREATSSAGAAQSVQLQLPHMMAFIPHNSISLGHQRLGFVCAPYHSSSSYGPKQNKVVYG